MWSEAEIASVTTRTSKDINDEEDLKDSLRPRIWPKAATFRVTQASRL